jgi:thiol-disulfide isomerase/thioredoxin
MRRTRFAWVYLLWPLTAVAAADRVHDVRLHDLEGQLVKPFSTGSTASVAFFVATDCPVSNGYAPEIQRVCRDYASRGVRCSLIYEDVDTARSTAVLDRQVRVHFGEYQYRDIPAIVDRSRAAATAVKATVTPTAVVVDAQGTVRYRGRVNDRYVALGKTRQQITSHDLRDALDAVLAGRRVANPETEAIGCFITDPAFLRTHQHD